MRAARRPIRAEARCRRSPRSRIELASAPQQGKSGRTESHAAEVSCFPTINSRSRIPPLNLRSLTPKQFHDGPWNRGANCCAQPRTKRTKEYLAQAELLRIEIWKKSWR